MGAYRTSVAMAAAIVASVAVGASAHVPLQPPGTLMVRVDLNVGGRPISGRGPGTCNYSPAASVHQSPGQMWRVQREGIGHDLTFTEWRLGKVDSFTLVLTVDGRRHRINTLQVGPAAERAGAGSVRYEQRGRAGAFSINAVSDTGVKITGTLACSGFVPPEAD